MKLSSILFLLVLFSCNNEETKTEDQHVVDSGYEKSVKDYSMLTKKVFDGDTSAYNELKFLYGEQSPKDFLYWAMLMANKNNYAQANLDVFDIIVTSYVGKIEYFREIDKETQKLALGFLKRAIKLKVHGARDILKKIENLPSEIPDSVG
ncbi:hypothetical protein ACE193_24735 [Bernardetia sp. OM2101]|uniref:hypothetical protein n=1 Tax=Bernardetia sp. OM2101 TaxID=3344876 RepID=UPI0035CF9380